MPVVTSAFNTAFVVGILLGEAVGDAVGIFDGDTVGVDVALGMKSHDSTATNGLVGGAGTNL